VPRPTHTRYITGRWRGREEVYYREVAREGGSDYTIDHSAFLYLMDRDGRFIGFLPPGTSADRIAEALRDVAAQALNRGR